MRNAPWQPGQTAKGLTQHDSAFSIHHGLSPPNSAFLTAQSALGDCTGTLLAPSLARSACRVLLITMMLELSGVVAGYGSTTCLKGISLAVEQGEIVTLLGANGAGKTTTLMTISGLVRAHQGTILFKGRRIERRKPEAIAALGVGHVPEGRRVFPRLSVLENLQLGAFMRRDRMEIAADLEKIWALFPILAQRRKQIAGTLSGGEQQMLAIGRGLMGRPSLLLLDEPSLGLAPKVVMTMFDIIRRINAAGVTILLVEQNAHLALQVAHRGYILETGCIVLADSAGALAASPQVKAAYLGG